MKVKELYHCLDTMAPFDTQEEFDNCGLVVGDGEAEIDKIGMALDITHDIIDKALAEGISLIVTHHPPIFHPLRQIHAGHVVYRLIQNGISVISCHTNLDKAEGGVNTILAEHYGLPETVSPEILRGLGRMGTLPQPLPVAEYARKIKLSLGAQSVRYLDCGRPAQCVVYISGGGAGQFRDAVQCGADTFITGDIKHDLMIDAKNIGLNLIEAGHFDSENQVFESLGKRLSAWSGTGALLLSTKNPVQVV